MVPQKQQDDSQWRIKRLWRQEQQRRWIRRYWWNLIKWSGAILALVTGVVHLANELGLPGAIWRALFSPLE